MLFAVAIMASDLSDILSRIDRALTRIEVANTLASTVPNDGRYDRLRVRTQTALAQLDTVIARIAREDAR